MKFFSHPLIVVFCDGVIIGKFWNVNCCRGSLCPRTFIATGTSASALTTNSFVFFLSRTEFLIAWKQDGLVAADPVNLILTGTLSDRLGRVTRR